MRFYTVKDLAQAMGVTPCRVHALVRKGRIETTRVGRNYVVPEHGYVRAVASPRWGRRGSARKTVGLVGVFRGPVEARTAPPDERYDADAHVLTALVTEQEGLPMSAWDIVRSWLIDTDDHPMLFSWAPPEMTPLTRPDAHRIAESPPGRVLWGSRSGRAVVAWAWVSARVEGKDPDDVRAAAALLSVTDAEIPWARWALDRAATGPHPTYVMVSFPDDGFVSAPGVAPKLRAVGRSLAVRATVARQKDGRT